MHATDFAEPSIALSSDLDVGGQSNYQPQPKSEHPPQPRLHPQPKQHRRFVATGGRGIFFLVSYYFEKYPQKFMYFLSNLRTFCVISFTDGVN